MFDVQWLSINNRSGLLFNLTDGSIWDDYRPLAQHALLLQSADGIYPTDAIFDLTDCRTEIEALAYSVKRLLDLGVMPNLEYLTLVGNRKRIHKLAEILNAEMPFEVHFARRIEDVKPRRRSRMI